MSVRDLASSSSGAVILSASSCDLAHPAQNVLEPTEESGYWTTTGSFPQELVIQLGSSAALKNVELVSLGIRKVEVAKCEGSQANTWETVATDTSDDAEDVQRFRIDIPPRITATYLRIKVAVVQYVTVGSGNSGSGGKLVLCAGTTTDGADSGGDAQLKTGYRLKASSGDLQLMSADAGTGGEEETVSGQQEGEKLFGWTVLTSFLASLVFDFYSAGLSIFLTSPSHLTWKSQSRI